MPSKKRRMSSGSASSGVADRPDANAVVARAARRRSRRPAAGECGTKSLPVAARRRCANQVEHAGVVDARARGRACGACPRRRARSRCRRRGRRHRLAAVAQSARTGGVSERAWRRRGKHAGRQVAVAAIADDEHDRRVLDLCAKRAARPRRRRPSEMPPKMPSSRARRRVDLLGVRLRSRSRSGRRACASKIFGR